MTRQRAALVLALCLWAPAVLAQTSTPTNTPVNTSTATVTATPTPTVNQDRVLANNETCASAPCDLTAVPVGAGIKTIVASTNTGTATIAAVCRNGAGHLQSDVVLGTLTGAGCPTPGTGTEGNTCLLTTRAWCDQMFIRLTACGSSCRVTAWLRTDQYHQR